MPSRLKLPTRSTQSGTFVVLCMSLRRLHRPLHSVATPLGNPHVRYEAPPKVHTRCAYPGVERLPVQDLATLRLLQFDLRPDRTTKADRDGVKGRFAHGPSRPGVKQTRISAARTPRPSLCLGKLHTDSSEPTQIPGATGSILGLNKYSRTGQKREGWMRPRKRWKGGKLQRRAELRTVCHLPSTVDGTGGRMRAMTCIGRSDFPPLVPC